MLGLNINQAPGTAANASRVSGFHYADALEENEANRDDNENPRGDIGEQKHVTQPAVRWAGRARRDVRVISDHRRLRGTSARRASVLREHVNFLQSDNHVATLYGDSAAYGEESESESVVCVENVLIDHIEKQIITVDRLSRLICANSRQSSPRYTLFSGTVILRLRCPKCMAASNKMQPCFWAASRKRFNCAHNFVRCTMMTARTRIACPKFSLSRPTSSKNFRIFARTKCSRLSLMRSEFRACEILDLEGRRSLVERCVEVSGLWRRVARR